MTDREVIREMLIRTNTRVDEAGDFIELINSEITFYFKEDDSLDWINNDRYIQYNY